MKNSKIYAALFFAAGALLTLFADRYEIDFTKLNFSLLALFLAGFIITLSPIRVLKTFRILKNPVNADAKIIKINYCMKHMYSVAIQYEVNNEVIESNIIITSLFFMGIPKVDNSIKIFYNSTNHSEAMLAGSVPQDIIHGIIIPILAAILISYILTSA